VASFIYEGDAPLAERRALALAIDQAQLRELLGEAELREILGEEALGELEARLQQLPPELRARSADGLADLLLRLGDLTRPEIERRCATPEVAASLDRLVAEGRVVPIQVAAEERFVAVEDAARYRDGLGVALPDGVPEALLSPVAGALDGLVLRYARRHAPFTMGELASRLGLGRAAAERVLGRLVRSGRLLEGAFRPHGVEREWCDPEVLRMVRRRSLARLREEIEPVEPPVLGRALLAWHGIPARASGAEAILDALERLQGAPLPASLLETEILPARVEGYLPGDLDALAASGEVMWVGLEPVGERDGRIALYLAAGLPTLSPPTAGASAPEGERARRILDHLAGRGASFFTEVHAAAGGGFPQQTVDALWALVFAGLVTNDTFQALRAFTRPVARGERARRAERRALRAGYPGAPDRARVGGGGRLATPPEAVGRWTLVAARRDAGGRPPTPTEWSAAVARQLLVRHGLVTRGAAAAEGLPGGLGAVHDVLRHMEEAGRIRRGYFVAGVGAMQFADPGALDLLRSCREPRERPEVVTLAATDPASPWGALLEWPPLPGALEARRPARAVGAQVVLVDGAVAAWAPRGLRQLISWLPEDEPERSRVGEGTAAALADLARLAYARGEGVLVEEVNGIPAPDHPLAGFLVQVGFLPSAPGLRFPRPRVTAALPAPDPE
jgi:ATP-dependent Lhr-like helicase